MMYFQGRCEWSELVTRVIYLVYKQYHPMRLHIMAATVFCGNYYQLVVYIAWLTYCFLYSEAVPVREKNYLINLIYNVNFVLL